MVDVVATVLMSKAEARAETDAIKVEWERLAGEFDAVQARLQAAAEHEIWRALGYTSMARYITAEFTVSRRHAYRLIDQMNVSLQLTEVAGGVTQRVTHRQAKTLKEAGRIDDVVSLVQSGHTAEEAIEHVTAEPITRSPFAGGSAAPDFEAYDDGSMVLRCRGCQRVGAVGVRFEVLRGGSGEAAASEDGIVRERFIE